METIIKKAINKDEKSIYMIAQIIIWFFNFLIMLTLFVLKLF